MWRGVCSVELVGLVLYKLTLRFSNVCLCLRIERGVLFTPMTLVLLYLVRGAGRIGLGSVVDRGRVRLGRVIERRVNIGN